MLQPDICAIIVVGFGVFARAAASIITDILIFSMEGIWPGDVGRRQEKPMPTIELETVSKFYRPKRSRKGPIHISMGVEEVDLTIRQG